MCAAINFAVSLRAVADHFATAMGAARGERVNRAFEAVEDMALSLRRHFEALVVIIPADFTFRHFVSFP